MCAGRTPPVSSVLGESAAAEEPPVEPAEEPVERRGFEVEGEAEEAERAERRRTTLSVADSRLARAGGVRRWGGVGAAQRAWCGTLLCGCPLPKVRARDDHRPTGPASAHLVRGEASEAGVETAPSRPRPRPPPPLPFVMVREDARGVRGVEEAPMVELAVFCVAKRSSSASASSASR